MESSIPFLPGDIIINILIKLSTKNIIRCRLVCKTRRELISTPNFVDLHFQHSIPMIFVAKAEDTPFLLDKWWEPTRPKLMDHRPPTDSAYFPLFSHSGLIVYEKACQAGTERKFILHNPLDSSKVRVICSEKLLRCEIYGVFFHPVLKDYCSLWNIETSESDKSCHNKQQSTQIHYKMLKFGTNPLLKTIKNPFIHRVHRSYNKCPLFIHKYLYWMLDCEPKNQKVEEYVYSGCNDIMQFDVISEEFIVKPCPVPLDTNCIFDQTYLLDIDGALSFVLIFPSKITIYRLEDHAQQLWTGNDYNFCRPICPSMEIFPTPIAVVDGKLALLSNRRLLVCNLMQGTSEFIQKNKFYKDVLVLSHRLSLASLINCKSNIYIGKDGDINVNFLLERP